MLTSYSIKDLYTLALAEGEGMGTAYEYFAKRRALDAWLRDRPKPLTMLIAGLPERYGLSLDLLLLASELGARVTVVDERAETLDHLLAVRQPLVETNFLHLALPETRVVDDLTRLEVLEQHFDLTVSSEVLQRLRPDARRLYIDDIWGRSSGVALFAPNADNPAHTNRSGLSGLHLSELEALLSHGEASPTGFAVGYIDMPPFPPGITRSDEQREQATSGTFESMVMWGLGQYARREHWFPRSMRQTQSHIVYGFAPA